MRLLRWLVNAFNLASNVQFGVSLGVAVVLAGFIGWAVRHLGLVPTILIGVGTFIVAISLIAGLWGKIRGERLRERFRERALELQGEVSGFALQLQESYSDLIASPNPGNRVFVLQQQNLLVLYEVRYGGRVQRLARELLSEGIIQKDDVLFHAPVNALHAREIAGRLGEVADWL